MDPTSVGQSARPLASLNDLALRRPCSAECLANISSMRRPTSTLACINRLLASSDCARCLTTLSGPLLELACGAGLDSTACQGSCGWTLTVVGTVALEEAQEGLSACCWRRVVRRNASEAAWFSCSSAELRSSAARWRATSSSFSYLALATARRRAWFSPSSRAARNRPSARSQSGRSASPPRCSWGKPSIVDDRECSNWVGLGGSQLAGENCNVRKPEPIISLCSRSRARSCSRASCICLSSGRLISSSGGQASPGAALLRVPN